MKIALNAAEDRFLLFAIGFMFAHEQRTAVSENMQKTLFLCKYAHIYARAVKVEVIKRDVNCKLRDSRFEGEMFNRFI